MTKPQQLELELEADLTIDSIVKMALDVGQASISQDKVSRAYHNTMKVAEMAVTLEAYIQSEGDIDKAAYLLGVSFNHMKMMAEVHNLHGAYLQTRQGDLFAETTHH